MVLLVTSDNEQFHADKEVVERSVLIKNMLEGVLHATFVLPLSYVFARCRWKWPTYSPPQRLIQRFEKSTYRANTFPQNPLTVRLCAIDRFWSTASTIVENLCRLRTPMLTRMRHANERPILESGIKNSLPWIRRCSLRLFLPPTTSISNHCCTSFSILFYRLIMFTNIRLVMLGARLSQTWSRGRHQRKSGSFSTSSTTSRQRKR